MSESASGPSAQASASAPAVSVILPTYNRGCVLGRAISSVLSQTCGEFELIVVDDGSTDRTEAVVREIQDPRIRYLRSSRQRGGSASRNEGMRAARGEYIAFLDSDDEWLPEKLEKQLAVLRASPSEVGLGYAWAWSIDPDGGWRRIEPTLRGNIYPALLERNVVGGLSSVMIRREVIGHAGEFDETLPARQDLDLYLRIAERFTVDFVPECLVIFHCEGEDRITRNTAAKIAGRHLFYEKHREAISAAGLAPSYLRQSGRLCEMAGDIRGARTLYLASLRADPLYLESYRRLLISFLPRSLKSALAQLRGAR